MSQGPDSVILTSGLNSLPPVNSENPTELQGLTARCSPPQGQIQFMLSFQIAPPKRGGPAWSVETEKGQRGFWSLQWACQGTSKKRKRAESS